MDKNQSTISFGKIYLTLFGLMFIIFLWVVIAKPNPNPPSQPNTLELKQYTTDTLKRAEQKIKLGQQLSPDEKRIWDSYNKWEAQEYDKKQRSKYGN